MVKRHRSGVKKTKTQADTSDSAAPASVEIEAEHEYLASEDSGSDDESDVREEGEPLPMKRNVRGRSKGIKQKLLGELPRGSEEHAGAIAADGAARQPVLDAGQAATAPPPSHPDSAVVRQRPTRMMHEAERHRMLDNQGVEDSSANVVVEREFALAMEGLYIGEVDLDPLAITAESMIREVREAGIEFFKRELLRVGWNFGSRVIVTRRQDGSYGCIDGMHRITALTRIIRESGTVLIPPDFRVPARLYGPMSRGLQIISAARECPPIIFLCCRDSLVYGGGRD